MIAPEPSQQATKPAQTILLTALAMIAFAGNSLLCRFALKLTRIDAASFTSIRILSGAIVLWIVVRIRGHAVLGSGNWFSAVALFLYAAAFSFAYISLPAGTGALLLFAAVQATMIAWGLRQGERLHLRQWIGLILGAAGLVLLLSPGLSAPPLGGSLLMLSAGVAWGAYSLRGRTGGDPTNSTAGNFLRAVPLAVLLSAITLPWMQLNAAGIAYAVVSGALTSGIGYVIWYRVLPALKATSAAAVQLSAPVLAAAGGILLLGESLTLRFLLSALAVLSGIALVVFQTSPVTLPTSSRANKE